MLSTKEETKTAVLKHLKSLPESNVQVEAYTLSSISESVKIDSSMVSTALDDLENEDLIISKKVQINVYVTKNQDGSRILSSFALKEYIGYSQSWAFLFAAVIFFVLLMAFGSFQFQTTSQTETVSDVYTTGVHNGALLSLLTFFVGGVLLQTGLTRFRRWQIVSEKSYRLIGNLIKHSAYLFIPLLIAFYVILFYFSTPLEPTIILGLLTFSVGTSIAYEALKKRLEGNKE